MSKRIIILMTLALMVFAASSFAWEHSFRSEASGMLFWGDFDNDLDPIYIHDNKGYRFYSILSNLTSKSNEFFNSGTNDNTFLIGTSGQFGIPTKFPWESRTSFIVQLADETWSDNSGLDGNMDGDLFDPVDYGGSGEQDGKWIEEYNWNPTNGIFDFNLTNTSMVSNIDVMKSRNWQLTHSYTDGNKTLGISFRHWGYYDEWHEPSFGFNYLSPQFNFEYYNTEVLTDMTGGASNPWVIYRGSRTGEFETTYESPENEIKLSFEMPFNPVSNSEIRFDLVYDKWTEEQSSNNFVNFVDMVNDTLTPVIDTAMASERYQMTGDYGGSFIMPGVQLTKHWAPETYSWFRFDFGFGSYDLVQTQRNDYNTYSYTNTVFGTNQRETAYSEEKFSGDADITEMHFYHKTVHEFSPNFLFAAGFEWTHRKDEAKDVPFTYNYMYEYDYRDSADQFNGATDYRYMEMETGSAKYSQTYKECGFHFPVAMEYVQGRWTFRLGGVHHIEKYTYESGYSENGWDVYSDTTMYGDGTGSAAVPPSGGAYEMRNSKEEHKEYWTDFYYGLQYMPNKNLKLELMDFMRTGEDFNDSEFFSGLRFGLTLLW